MSNSEEKELTLKIQALVPLSSKSKHRTLDDKNRFSHLITSRISVPLSVLDVDDILDMNLPGIKEALTEAFQLLLRRGVSLDDLFFDVKKLFEITFGWIEKERNDQEQQLEHCEQKILPSDFFNRLLFKVSPLVRKEQNTLHEKVKKIKARLNLLSSTKKEIAVIQEKFFSEIIVGIPDFLYGQDEEFSELCRLIEKKKTVYAIAKEILFKMKEVAQLEEDCVELQATILRKRQSFTDRLSAYGKIAEEYLGQEMNGHASIELAFKRICAESESEISVLEKERNAKIQTCRRQFFGDFEK